MSTKYFRAKADTGWTKQSIAEYINDVAGDEGEDRVLGIDDFTDDDCQWFADKVFEIDAPSEEDLVDERKELSMQLFDRITSRG